MYLFYLCTTIRPKIKVHTDLFSYLHTIIRPNYRVLFHLLFLQCITIRPKIRVFIDRYVSFAHDHSTKIYDLFLSLILSLCTTIRPKISILINLSFLFVHDHSKLWVTLIFKFIIFLIVPIFCLHLYFVRYNHTLTFRTLYSLGGLLLYFVRYICGYMKSSLDIRK